MGTLRDVDTLGDVEVVARGRPGQIRCARPSFAPDDRGRLVITATEVYGFGLRGGRVWLEGSQVSELPVRDWTRDCLDGDHMLLARCKGPTLDIGCGPGRLAAALLARRVLALGIDISHEAVALARARGAGVLQSRRLRPPCRARGSWQHALLADGKSASAENRIRLLRPVSASCSPQPALSCSTCRARALTSGQIASGSSPAISPVTGSIGRACRPEPCPRLRPRPVLASGRYGDRRDGGRPNCNSATTGTPRTMRTMRTTELVPRPEWYPTRGRGGWLSLRVGLWLGVTFTTCFVTGLISHFHQHPGLSAGPVWGYAVSQGIHITTGIASIPLLAVKLWSVAPRFWQRPLIGGVLRMLERGSVLVLVASAVFELVTGLLNVAEWYAFGFDSRPSTTPSRGSPSARSLSMSPSSSPRLARSELSQRPRPPKATSTGGTSSAWRVSEQ